MKLRPHSSHQQTSEQLLDVVKILEFKFKQKLDLYEKLGKSCPSFASFEIAVNENNGARFIPPNTYHVYNMNLLFNSWSENMNYLTKRKKSEKHWQAGLKKWLDGQWRKDKKPFDLTLKEPKILEANQLRNLIIQLSQIQEEIKSYVQAPVVSHHHHHYYCKCGHPTVNQIDQLNLQLLSQQNQGGGEQHHHYIHYSQDQDNNMQDNVMQDNNAMQENCVQDNMMQDNNNQDNIMHENMLHENVVNDNVLANEKEIKEQKQHHINNITVAYEGVQYDNNNSKNTQFIDQHPILQQVMPHKTKKRKIKPKPQQTPPNSFHVDWPFSNPEINPQYPEVNLPQGQWPPQFPEVHLPQVQWPPQLPEVNLPDVQWSPQIPEVNLPQVNWPPQFQVQWPPQFPEVNWQVQWQDFTNSFANIFKKDKK